MILPLAVSLALSVAPLPKDTLRMDSAKIIGVAVPTSVAYTKGDLNFDGRVSTSDIILLVRFVLLEKPLPKSPDTVGVYTVHNDKLYLFLPTDGRAR